VQPLVSAHLESYVLAMRKQALAALFAALVLHSLSSAEAHVGAAPGSIGVFVAPDGGDAIGLESTFGLLLSDGGPEYYWLCHEAIIEIGTTITPRYAMNSQGVILGTTGALASSRDSHETLYRTTDNCNWLTTSGLTDQVTTDVAFSPSDPNRAIVSTATLDLGIVNGLYFSEDSGATWQASNTTSDERLFRNVHFGDDGTAWATASWFNPLGAWLYRSDDAGVTWQEVEVSYEVNGSRQVLLEVLAATGSGPQVWLRADAPVTDVLLHSSDGGVTFTEVLDLDTELAGAARTDDGSTWLVDGVGRLHNAAPGGDFLVADPSPSSSGIDADSRGLFVSTVDLEEEYALLLSSDGLSYEGLFNLADVSPPPKCDEGSHSRVRCDPYWVMVMASLATGDDDDSAGDDDDSADDDDDDDDDQGGDDDDWAGGDSDAGCCAGAGSDGAPLISMAFLLTLGLGGSRRRRLHPSA
jgi:hypothetical protein